MRLVAIAFMLGILLFGCAQQADAGQNAAGTPAPGAAQPQANATPNRTPVTAPQPGMENLSATFTIHIKNFAFDPVEATVTRGAKVVWVNDDATPHSINGGAAFTSPTISNGATYERIFTEAGDYPYSCGIHPSMSGKIVVR